MGTKNTTKGIESHSKVRGGAVTLLSDAANTAPSSSPQVCLVSGTGIGDLRRGRFLEWLPETHSISSTSASPLPSEPLDVTEVVGVRRRV